MFCLHCGASDQQALTYCRSCGTLLPDSKNSRKRAIPPEEYIRKSNFVSVATLALSILTFLYLLFVFRLKDAPMAVVFTQVILLLFASWQVLAIVRNKKLSKAIDKQLNEKGLENSALESQGEGASRHLPGANIRDIVPASIVEGTTRDLANRKPIGS